MASFLYLAPAPLPLADDGGGFEAKREEEAKSAAFFPFSFYSAIFKFIAKNIKCLNSFQV